VKYKFILASSSARRKDLLDQIGVVPDEIIAADIDESPLKNELPRDYVVRVANEKALKVSENYKDDIVLAADTAVSCGRRILPKCESDEQVRMCMKLLSGRQHSVYSAVCVASPVGVSRKIVATKVKFKSLSRQEIAEYIKTGEGIGKAGGYAIQGMAATFVKNINGSYSSVVGLPLYEVKNILNGIGYGK